MQLINVKSRKLASLTLAGSILSASSFAFDYNTLEHSLNQKVVTNDQADNILKLTQENKYFNFGLRIEFNRLVKEWEKRTAFMSFANHIVEDENFKKIVSYGQAMVPFIIEEINEKPSPLVWALNYIFDMRISESDKLTIEDACKLWVKKVRS
jgi:hypothetical protein